MLFLLFINNYPFSFLDYRVHPISEPQFNDTESRFLVASCLPNVCQVKKNTPSRYLESVFLCPGRESNPHGRFGPRDFRTTVAFAIRRASRRACLGSGLFLHHRTGSIRCVVSSLCTFLLPEAWLKITISMTC